VSVIALALSLGCLLFTAVGLAVLAALLFRSPRAKDDDRRGHAIASVCFASAACLALGVVVAQARYPEHSGGTADRLVALERIVPALGGYVRGLRQRFDDIESSRVAASPRPAASSRVGAAPRVEEEQRANVNVQAFRAQASPVEPSAASPPSAAPAAAIAAPAAERPLAISGGRDAAVMPPPSNAAEAALALAGSVAHARAGVPRVPENSPRTERALPVERASPVTSQATPDVPAPRRPLAVAAVPAAEQRPASALAPKPHPAATTAEPHPVNPKPPHDDDRARDRDHTGRPGQVLKGIIDGRDVTDRRNVHKRPAMDDGLGGLRDDDARGVLATQAVRPDDWRPQRRDVAVGDRDTGRDRDRDDRGGDGSRDERRGERRDDDRGDWRVVRPDSRGSERSRSRSDETLERERLDRFDGMRGDRRRDPDIDRDSRGDRFGGRPRVDVGGPLGGVTANPGDVGSRSGGGFGGSPSIDGGSRSRGFGDRDFRDRDRAFRDRDGFRDGRRDDRGRR
jgi:hypothetical protein